VRVHGYGLEVVREGCNDNCWTELGSYLYDTLGRLECLNTLAILDPLANEDRLSLKGYDNVADVVALMTYLELAHRGSSWLAVRVASLSTMAGSLIAPVDVVARWPVLPLSGGGLFRPPVSLHRGPQRLPGVVVGA